MEINMQYNDLFFEKLSDKIVVCISNEQTLFCLRILLKQGIRILPQTFVLETE